MPFKCNTITNYMELLAPRRLSQNWDNTGLLLGDPEQQISKVLVVLDVTSEVVEEAIEQGAQLIITHHPIIFKPINKLLKDKPHSDLIFRLIKNNISVYSAHSNLDLAKGGVNDTLASVLGLKDVEVLQPVGCKEEFGFFRIGKLDEPIDVMEFAAVVKKQLGIEKLRLVGETNKKIRHIVVSAGSYSNIAHLASERGAEIIVTGDLKYHDAREIADYGLTGIDAGHFATENIIVPVVAKYISGLNNLNMDIKVIKSEKSQDIFKVV